MFVGLTCTNWFALQWRGRGEHRERGFYSALSLSSLPLWFDFSFRPNYTNWFAVQCGQGVPNVIVRTNWLTPSFKSDWQEHSSIKVQTAPSNFLALTAQCAIAPVLPPNSSYHSLAKTMKTINCSFLPPYNVYLTWLAMRLAH